MEINIEDIAEAEGRKIANAIKNEDGKYPYLMGKKTKTGFLNDLVRGYKEHSERKNIEREIYERSLHFATAFFLKNSEAKFNDKIIHTLRSRLDSWVVPRTNLSRLSPEEFLGTLIKFYTIDFLIEHNIFVQY